MEENQTINPETRPASTRSFTYMSETIGEISAALSQLQGSIEQPKLEKEVKVKLKNGGEYKFKYADLSACVKSAAPVLKENGLAVSQIVNDGKLITILSHKSGEWIKSELFLPTQTSDCQAYGSAITYLKRYSYCAILGIVADTDDDANIAGGNKVEMKDRRTGVAEVKTVAFTGGQLKHALDEIDAAQTEDDMKYIWNRWRTDAPALCQNGSEFYKAFIKKRREINQPKAQ